MRSVSVSPYSRKVYPFIHRLAAPRWKSAFSRLLSTSATKARRQRSESVEAAPTSQETRRSFRDPKTSRPEFLGGTIDRWSAKVLVHVLLALVLCSGCIGTLQAQSISPKINTVLLSSTALKKMERLISLKPGRAAKDVAATGSMQPLFDENYIIIIEKTKFEQLVFGDIVIFRGTWANGLPVAHRLVGLNAGKAGWRTKGDHCEKDDLSFLTEQNYEGFTVVAAVHKLTGELRQLSAKNINLN